MLNSIDWIDALNQIKETNIIWVLVTVIGTKGSTPRDRGTKMIITEKDTFDTIGGGRFEFQVIAEAREMIKNVESNNSTNGGEEHQKLLNFPLAAKTNQCCGGHVTVMLEVFEASQQAIHIFGAGHVAKTLIPIIKQMNYKIYWVDNREELLSHEPESSKVQHCIYDDIFKHIHSMKPNSIALVLTHDHRLDYKIICGLLDRKDCAFIGLIGSKTKAMRFKRRLKTDAFRQSEIDQVNCPIGLDGIPGKKPIEISISIAAQLVQNSHINKEKTIKNNVTWKQINNQLTSITNTVSSIEKCTTRETSTLK